MSENDEVYDVARRELDALVSDMTINAATIMQLLKISMEITEATQLKGEEQRKLCIKLVKDVIVAAPLIIATPLTPRAPEISVLPLITVAPLIWVAPPTLNVVFKSVAPPTLNVPFTLVSP